MRLIEHLQGRALLAGAAALLSLSFATPATAACADLANFPLIDGKVTSAVAVAQNAPIALPGLPLTLPAPSNFCRVAVTLTPTPDSSILAELWLPDPSAWNEKFLGSGNGGFGGSVAGPMLDMRMALTRGYATAGDDLGHETPFPKIDASWALGHPEKVNDFAYRADHVTAVAAKTLIAAYYGKPPKLSYFRGCSNGGHEAMMEAIRYPQDYDGIIAGAPANSWTHLMAAFLWNEQALTATPGSRIPDAKLMVVQNAILAQCDDKDGVKDGIINEPAACRFEPKTLLCKSGDGPDCLTQAQLDALEKIYGGPVNPKTHRSIYPGWPMGSGEGLEKNWTGWITAPDASQAQFANAFYGTIVKADPNWDYRSFDFSKAVDAADAGVGQIVNSNNPDLSAFAAHGGKLILFQGWDDAAVTAYGTIAYYQAVQKKMGAKAASFVRLFVAPGMMHCGGGPGPNSLDCVTALEQWREKGVAPSQVAASHYANPMAVLAGLPMGDPTSTRPICAYPNVAHWTGTGSSDQAANYVCKPPTATGRRTARR